MKKHLKKLSNWILLAISLILCAFMAIVLGMKIMFPVLIFAVIALGVLEDEGKRDWPAVIATVLGGLIIQIFIWL